MKLSNLIVDVKKAWINFPGTTFEVELAHLAKPEVIRLRKSCIETHIDRKTRYPQEKLNEEKFVKMFTEKTILNWRGLTMDILETLVAINAEGVDPKTELPYSKENAIELITNSSVFDEWVNDAVFDLENFRSGGARETVEEAE